MAAVTEPAVFFTGFPGFLGSALLERVLARGDGPVACLVQPPYLETARRRAREITEEAASGTRADADREDAIRLYEGDITDPDLGLDDAGGLESIREVYHLAAVYDLGVERELAEAVNVRGTEHVLEFATDRDVERFHYVSTCYVSGRYDGVFTEAHLREGQSFNNHYEETKFRAEVAVRERMAAGMPATVYRPAIVVGDSRTGETDKYDGPYYLLQSILAQPSWLSATVSVPGSSDAELNVVPRDFVVDAIAYLSGRESSVGEVYQLCDPSPPSVPRFVDALVDATGHRCVTLTIPKPLARTLLDRLEGTRVSVEPATIDYLDHPTRYACPATRQALSGSGLEVPPFESYVDRLVGYARENPDVGGEPMI
ncbi:SDR family oxidoreductase [Natrarchaeobius chitinivorans]|uniref:NAD-dependent epimerase/dehydratase family protein n=1 Tax=Natrarchaeobius chitinivorans TaxID=1679083 RepID=A0A3N6M752_NATCH|nr:SDR family oxidoreductase [Natrarchaeobius chitinivorans]RQG98057.1 NAD-dependent epimerase/dehydratase family protein [Natrarchaeobius chitinivorans]